MSQSYTNFLESIKDSEELLRLFDTINTKPPPANSEVLKRAGLIMALTAWESYIKERAEESLSYRLAIISGSPIASFVKSHFDLELKRLNNPNSAKTKKLFLDFLGIDVTAHWLFNGNSVKVSCETLDQILGKRGDAAHQSRTTLARQQGGHLVKREDLEKAIRFIKLLVEKTELALNMDNISIVPGK